MNDSNELIIPEFIRYLIEKRGEKVHKKFQEFLQDSNLSSHVWVLAQKLMIDLNKYRNIIFDFDGVILDTNTLKENNIEKPLKSI